MKYPGMKRCGKKKSGAKKKVTGFKSAAKGIAKKNKK